MPVSNAQKASAAKWDSAHMENVSCRITKEKKQQFKLACENLGTSMHAVLKDAVDATIARAAEKDQK